MPNPEITNNSTNGVVIRNPVFEDDVITFAGAATLLAGTILARDSVSGNLVPYVIGGVTNENGIPKAVIRDALTAAGAGDIPCRVIISGHLRLSHLVVDADGDNSNINKGILDELRDFTIIGLESTQLMQLDNQ